MYIIASQYKSGNRLMQWESSTLGQDFRLVLLKNTNKVKDLPITVNLALDICGPQTTR